MTTAEEIRWICEFYHPHFRWLDLDHRFATREEAEAYSVRLGSAYPRRVRAIKVTSTGDPN